jgi:uncharacterized RDD family membrane protein YckC
MRCPKCQYISFDASDRCRNCGYDFSLAQDDAAPAIDLPIRTGNEPLGPMSDFQLAAAAARATLAARGVGADAAPLSAGRGASALDLPLFLEDGHGQAPLVRAPAEPRPPLAVRRRAPATPRASERDTPQLDLQPQEQLRKLARRLAESDERQTAEQDLASLGARLAAGIIDLAIICAIDVAVLYFTLKLCDLPPAQIARLPTVPLVAFLLMLNGGYAALFTAAGGQTMGKMAARIRVVPADAPIGSRRRVPFGAAALRSAAYLVSVLPAGLGFVLALFADDRRALHDRLADTRVVRA